MREQGRKYVNKNGNPGLGLGLKFNPIYHAIRIWGPKKLISLANEEGLIRHLPKEYIQNSICHACYSLNSNNKIREFLYSLAEKPEFKRKVAYARLYYLREARMYELMKDELNKKPTKLVC